MLIFIDTYLTRGRHRSIIRFGTDRTSELCSPQNFKSTKAKAKKNHFLISDKKQS